MYAFDPQKCEPKLGLVTSICEAWRRGPPDALAGFEPAPLTLLTQLDSTTRNNTPRLVNLGYLWADAGKETEGNRWLGRAMAVVFIDRSD